MSQVTINVCHWAQKELNEPTLRNILSQVDKVPIQEPYQWSKLELAHSAEYRTRKENRSRDYMPMPVLTTCTPLNYQKDDNNFVLEYFIGRLCSES